MDVIANAALLLCTSDEEGFPNTFTQAWASGTPVVSLKVDPDNIIEKMRLGLISKSLDKLVADIELLIMSSEHREDIAGRARRYVTEKHNEATVVEIFNDALGNCHLSSKRHEMKLTAR